MKLVELHMMQMDIFTIIDQEFLAQLIGLNDSVASYIRLCLGVL